MYTEKILDIVNVKGKNARESTKRVENMLGIDNTRKEETQNREKLRDVNDMLKYVNEKLRDVNDILKYVNEKLRDVNNILKDFDEKLKYVCEILNHFDEKLRDVYEILKAN